MGRASAADSRHGQLSLSTPSLFTDLSGRSFPSRVPNPLLSVPSFCWCSDVCLCMFFSRGKSQKSLASQAKAQLPAQAPGGRTGRRPHECRQRIRAFQSAHAKCHTHASRKHKSHGHVRVAIWRLLAAQALRSALRSTVVQRADVTDCRQRVQRAHALTLLTAIGALTGMSPSSGASRSSMTNARRW